MSRVILVRHGETDWNREEIFRGRADPPLNKKGQNQAEAAGRAISAFKVSAVYSSPLNRSLETAKNIAKFHNLPVKEMEGFIDIDFGKWQGLTHKNVKKLYPGLYQRWLEEPRKVIMPGGESLDNVRKRSFAALKEILQKDKNGLAVVVSHRVVNKILICAILGLDNSSFWNIRQDNCALNIFEFRKNKFVVELINDTCHLKDFPNDIDRIDF